jgi:hypothetical protein
MKPQRTQRSGLTEFEMRCVRCGSRCARRGSIIPLIANIKLIQP